MSNVVEEGKEAVEQAEEEVTGDEAGNGGGAKRFLIPAAAGIGTLAATLAARKAPDLFRDHVKPKLEQKGGEEAAKIGEQATARLQGQGGVVGALAGKATEKLGGAGGREKTRRLPIQRWTDVAVPVDVAYQKWTEFEEFPKFMHRVVSVEKKDDKHVAWQEKIWFSRRQWEGEITDRRKNDRIAWKTTQGAAHAGIVSFHKLDTALTRVMIEMDFRPSGMIEKMASGLRFVKRAVEADLARFKAYVEMDDAKGLEYTQAQTSGEEQKEEKEKDEGSEADSSNGRGDASQARQQSNDELEKSRRERAERREERQK